MGKKPIQSVTISHVAIAGNLIIGLFAQSEKDHSISYELIALDAATGEKTWKQALEEPPSWGPVVWKDTILYMHQGICHSIASDGIGNWYDKDGNERTLDVSKFEFVSTFIEEDLLFFATDDGGLCYSLITGDGLWKTSMGLSQSNVSVTDEYTIIQGRVFGETTTHNLENMQGFMG